MRTLMSSEHTPWGVLDSWVNLGHPLEVYTVLADHAVGVGWLAEIRGDHQGAWGLAVVDRVTGEPADRLREALDQSMLRQRERLNASTQPIQIRPRRGHVPTETAAVTPAHDPGASHNSMADQHGEMRPVPRYAQDRHGRGRWVRLHRFGGPIGTLWTDDAQALGFIPDPGASVALLVSSIRSACELGTPASWVFDDHAAWASPDLWAGPVQRGDLATLRSG